MRKAIAAQDMARQFVNGSQFRTESEPFQFASETAMFSRLNGEGRCGGQRRSQSTATKSTSVIGLPRKVDAHVFESSRDFIARRCRAAL